MWNPSRQATHRSPCGLLPSLPPYIIATPLASLPTRRTATEASIAASVRALGRVEPSVTSGIGTSPAFQYGLRSSTIGLNVSTAVPFASAPPNVSSSKYCRPENAITRPSPSVVRLGYQRATFRLSVFDQPCVLGSE